ncbi:MAG: hypothetical protein AB3N16_11890 [Flavobacteriaceae bacterium]
MKGTNIFFLIYLVLLSTHLSAMQKQPPVVHSTVEEAEKVQKDTIYIRETVIIKNAPNPKDSGILEWWGISIPILLAIVGGFFAFRQIRYNNINRAKIEWVNKFRQTTSQYLTNIDSSAVNWLNTLEMKKKNAQNPTQNNTYLEYYKKYEEKTDLASQYYFQLKLLFHKDISDLVELETMLDKLDSLYCDVKNQNDMAHLRNEMKAFLEKSKNVLCEEWGKLDKKSSKT